MKKNQNKMEKKESNPLRMSALAAQKKGKEYAKEVYHYFADTDEHGRHQKNSRTIGHALITKKPTGELEATQYAIDHNPDADSAVVRELIDIHQVANNRTTWFRAKDLAGNKYISKRSLAIKTNEQDAELRYFSPYEYDSDEADELTDEEPLVLLRDDLKAEHQYLASMPPRIKQSSVELVAASVLQRDLDEKRSITQNEVMGRSAKEDFNAFLTTMKDALSPRLILILQRWQQHNSFTEFSPEWLHKIAHSLMPISTNPAYNPQHANNLAAAAKWANTEMMLSERIAKWFALREEGAKITVDSLFHLLLGSELIERINFQVTVKIDQRFIQFIQDIDVLKEYPLFRKTSDLAQAIAIADAIFQEKTPASIQRVEIVAPAKNPAMEALASQETIKHQVLCQSANVFVSPSEANAFHLLSSHPDFKVCRQVQEHPIGFTTEEPYSVACIIDVETTGLHPETDEIVELAVISFAYSKTKGILGVLGTYNGLNEPQSALSEEVSLLTGITNEQLAGQRIDWHAVSRLLTRSKYIICHNAQFDSAFLLQKTPALIQEQVRKIPFACTKMDINWFSRGVQIRKLDYLNFHLGYVYNAHRALGDCWATLNLLANEAGVFDELLFNAHKKHMYFFSSALINSAKEPAPVSLERTVDKSSASSEEVLNAYQLLSSLPYQYKIYSVVPEPRPVTDVAGATGDVGTLIEIQTSGNNYLNDSITAIALLSFVRANGELIVTDAYATAITRDNKAQWDSVNAILAKTQYVITHQSNMTRKFLEFCCPDTIANKIQRLPFASTATDVDWKSRRINETRLDYLSFHFGFFLSSSQLMSQAYAALNLLRTVPGVFDELTNRLHANTNIILACGSFTYALRDELKQKGFQFSSGAGAMGKGWWASMNDEQAATVRDWLSREKNKVAGKNEVFVKRIDAFARYSIRAEFKACDMRGQTSRKRPADETIVRTGPGLGG
ncbi:MAG: hypothetical protein CK426_06335 [Legionella sp.]|nr:MAG: hypothetical protein CK423_02555 [Legionella sp.]PJD98508.1 MAG: hypothetical protein CK426_06335 [Legionella sp.]